MPLPRGAMYSRHDLVWLTPAGWADTLASTPAHSGVLSRWRDAGWPLITTRQTPGTQSDTVCLGLAAPPQGGQKLRIALCVKKSGIESIKSPLPLRDAVAGAPASWRHALTALRDRLHGIDVRVFGSMAMQIMTGETYLNTGSDIDLLLVPNSEVQLRGVVTLLDTYTAVLPLDGEIVFPGGAAVSWKEWLQASAVGARVLVKEKANVRLASRADLLATLAN